MMRRFACFFLLACVLNVRAERELASPAFVANSGISMEITNSYETVPPVGFLPLRVEVKNGSAAERTWQFATTHNQGMGSTFASTTPLTVPARGKRVFDLLVPLAPQSSGSARYANLQISVSGYAVEDGNSSEHAGGGSSGMPTSFFGLGEELSVKNWGPLKELAEKTSKRSLDGTPLDSAFLPTDWRGLAGFEIIILNETEWRKISVAQQGALGVWVAQGGHLVLCHEAADAPQDLPAAASRGAGKISHWQVGVDFIDQINKEIIVSRKSLGDRTADDYTWSWLLAKAVGRMPTPYILVMVFVLGFAVLVGPVNFLVFAPPGNRHRLFWTTPLISVLATILIAGIIVGGEGIGGSGQRLEALLSLPSEHKAVLWQEQVSRTGVLTSSSFTPSEQMLPLPITLRQRGGSSFSRMAGNYALNGQVWSGDWFRSRATQAQVLISAYPTRGRLELAGNEGGIPQVISTFEQNLKEVFYYDSASAVWRGTDIAPGRKTALLRVEDKEYQKWRKDALAPAGGVIRDRFERFEKQDRRGKFFASASQLNPISTLPVLRWKPAGALIFGEIYQP